MPAHDLTTSTPTPTKLNGYLVTAALFPDEEIWAPVPGHLGFEVSSFGRIRSYKFKRSKHQGEVQKHEARILKCTLTGPSKKKYKSIGTRIGRKTAFHYLHHFVLEAFVGPRPPRAEALHRDDNQLNNHIENLRWGTHAENMADIDRNGNRKAGEDLPQTILSETQVHEIRRLAASGLSQRKIAPRFGISHCCVHRVVKRQTWKHV